MCFPDMKRVIYFFWMLFGRMWILFGFAILLGYSGNCFGGVQALPDVRRVEFTGLPDAGWIRMRIDFAFRFPSGGGENILKDRVENVTLRVVQCYGSEAAGFRFFRSAVEMVGLSVDKRYSVSFFLPEDLSYPFVNGGQPHSWLLEWKVDGALLESDAHSMSGSFAGRPDVLASFRKRFEAEAPLNDGILIPSWALPSHVECDRSDEPVIRRRDTCLGLDSFSIQGGKGRGE